MKKFKKRAFIDNLVILLILFLFFIILYIFFISENYLTLSLSLIIPSAIIYLIIRKKIYYEYFIYLFNNRQRIFIFLGLIFLIIFPLFLRNNAYIIHLLITIGIQIILALGLNIQVGSTGIPNLGFVGFFGIGAYTSALLAVKLGMSFWICIIFGGLAASILGLLLALPTAKLKSYYSALITIAFSYIMFNLFLNLKFFEGPDGVRGVPPPSLFNWTFSNNLNIFGLKYPMQLNFYYLILFFLLCFIIISYSLYNSRIGLIWNAIREDEIASKSVGINVVYYKILSFCVGAFYAGISGSLFAHYIGYISAQNFTFTISLSILSMVILGGLDNITGVILGAFLLTVLPEKFRILSNYRVIAYSIIIIIMLMFRPQGLIPQKNRSYKFIKLNNIKNENRNE